MYYVYQHTDPDTEEIVYVGYGSRDRAWKFPPLSPNHPSANRQPNHIAWMELKTAAGYVPSDWVKIVFRSTERNEARKHEAKMIKTLQPRYNLHNCNRSARRTKGDVEEMTKLYESGLTLRQVGDKFDVSRNTVKRYIDGKSKPREE